MDSRHATLGLEAPSLLTLVSLSVLVIVVAVNASAYEALTYFSAATVVALACDVGWRLARRHDPLAWPVLLTSAILALELALSPAALLATGVYTPDWLEGTGQPGAALADALLTTTIGGLAFIAAVSFRRRSTIHASSSIEPPPKSWIACGLLCSVASLWIRLDLNGGLSTLLTSEVFQERRVFAAGQGSIEFLSYGGLVALVMIALRLKRRSTASHTLLILVPASTLTALPFLISGQRGALLAVCILPYMALTLNRRTVPTIMRWVVPAAAALMFLEGTTGAIRTNIASDRPVFEDAWQRPEGVSRTFNHVELLAVVQEIKASDGGALPHTLLDSVLNWRPRQLFPDKGLTTGPVLAGLLSPNWIGADGLHRSSYTTGPVVEGYYLAGTAGALAAVVLVALILRRLAAWYSRSPQSSIRAAGYVIAAYLLGWNLWLDDLGGCLNKAILLAGWLALFSVSQNVIRAAFRVAPRLSMQTRELC